MSDIEKVRSYIDNFLRVDEPINLRWEGAGNCLHPYKILHYLANNQIRGRYASFNAEINLYEDLGDPVAIDAINRMEEIGYKFNQRVFINGNIDVNRDSTNSGRIHIMFARNIMPWPAGVSKGSGTRRAVRNMHQTALRNRSGSLTNDGRLMIGGSSQYSLHPKKNGNDTRSATPIRQLFTANHYDRLVGIGENVGMSPSFHRDTEASVDFDEGHIMQNANTQTFEKHTFYLTFIKSNH